MSENSKGSGIVIVVLRYIASLICIAIGVFIAMGGTNSMVGVSMAFICAFLISPLLDILLNLCNLHLNISLRAILVIVAVVVDIVSSKTKFWLWIDLGVFVFLFILFIIVSNVLKNKFSKKKHKPQMSKKQEVIKEEYSGPEVIQSAIIKPEVIKLEVVEPAVIKPEVKEKVVNNKKLLVFEEEVEVKKKRKSSLLDNPNSLLEYMLSHGYGLGVDEEIIVENTNLLLAALNPKERILFSFMGYHQYKSEFEHMGTFAYALTNQRLIFARKGSNGQIIQAIPLSKIENVQLRVGKIDGIISITTANNVIHIAMENDISKKIASRIQYFANEVKRLKIKVS